MKKSNTSSTIEARAADWLAAHDRAGSNGWPAERRQALEAWLGAATAHRIAYLRLAQAWRRAERLRALRAAAHPARALRPAPLRVRRAWLGLGLGLAVAAGLLAAGRLGLRQGSQRYATAQGQRQSVALDDGSRLTLNTATRLRTAVTPAAREVWLEQGEAFFEIAHDAGRPFVIHAGAQKVTVLGTKFSLFRDGDRLRVAVLEGRVQLQAPRSSRPTVLVRDDAALADAEQVLVTRQSSQQLRASLGWLQGKLVFDRVSLAEAVRQFNRYGRRPLVIADQAAAEIGIGGVFDADNAEAFVHLLHIGFGLEVQFDEQQIRIASPSF